MAKSAKKGKAERFCFYTMAEGRKPAGVKAKRFKLDDNITDYMVRKAK